MLVAGVEVLDAIGHVAHSKKNAIGGNHSQTGKLNWTAVRRSFPILGRFEFAVGLNCSGEGVEWVEAKPVSGSRRCQLLSWMERIRDDSAAWKPLPSQRSSQRPTHRNTSAGWPSLVAGEEAVRVPRLGPARFSPKGKAEKLAETHRRHLLRRKRRAKRSLRNDDLPMKQLYLLKA